MLSCLIKIKSIIILPINSSSYNEEDFHHVIRSILNSTINGLKEIQGLKTSKKQKILNQLIDSPKFFPDWLIGWEMEKTNIFLNNIKSSIFE